MDVTGVILAGGKSRRYGKNKALVKINGITLIEKTAGVMRSIFQQIIIITNTPDRYAYLKLPMYEDLIKDLGPLGGIHTALSAISSDQGFIVACDMPSLNRGLIRYMLDKRNGFDIVLPRVSDKVEPLHAFYSKRCLPAINKLIDSKIYQVNRFFPDVSILYIEEDKIREFDPDLKSFLNINRPQEADNYKKGIYEVNNI